ncbi:unnamed protein product [Cyprideis torosa]|uniref:Uncharacterized protein n=1 Tax=Cyprideis torosa TaxID=163714 RepID=A0A7R8W041_9CRUS|nr:unnamed protein product [Cyprideis torosa]CAG0879344.1 unnamed protein product [Cyprideis torosa]
MPPLSTRRSSLVLGSLLSSIRGGDTFLQKTEEEYDERDDEAMTPANNTYSTYFQSDVWRTNPGKSYRMGRGTMAVYETNARDDGSNEVSVKDLAQELEKLQEENQKLEFMYKRTQEKHESQIQALEDEIRDQMSRVDEEMGRQLQKELRKIRLEMGKEREEGLKSREASGPVTRHESMSERDFNGGGRLAKLKLRIESVEEENRSLKQELCDRETKVALLKSEMVMMKTQIAENVRRLKRQVNRNLVDTNDSLEYAATSRRGHRSPSIKSWSGFPILQSSPINVPRGASPGDSGISNLDLELSPPSSVVESEHKHALSTPRGSVDEAQSLGQGNSMTSILAMGPPERMFKVVLAGDSAVGKTCLINRICRNVFLTHTNSTLGIDFALKTLQVDGSVVTLQMWDTAGQERFRSLAQSYFRRSDGAIIVYDVTNESSFLNVRQWIEDAVAFGSSEDPIPIVILANKIDLNGSPHFRTVDSRRGQELAKECGAGFFETSCKTGANIEPALVQLVSPSHVVPSYGMNANWLGGPPIDANSENDQGGYGFFETSEAPTTGRFAPSAMLESPTFAPTFSMGECLNFRYNLGGQSAESLQVVLHPLRSEDEFFNPLERASEIVLWKEQAKNNAEDEVWKEADILYTVNSRYKILFEAIPRLDHRRYYRGYVAVDAISFRPSDQCSGHCSFDGGFCSWSNVGGDNDDFDWSLGRGSEDDQTGPKRDHRSFAFGGHNGGYAYIDTDYPRKFGDKAVLQSQQLAATERNRPRCMKFWTHMFGSGIGELNVYIQGDQAPIKIWSMRGPQGNTWYEAQVSIASGSGFRILFEATVGKNSLGQIAIDDISFREDACPVSPQIAATNKGDCSFETGSCQWRNVIGAVDDFDWERRQGGEGRKPEEDHSTMTDQGFFLTLPRLSSTKAMDRAFLALEFNSTESPTPERPGCLSFWYYMFEPFIDINGPSLGSLQVHLRYMNEDRREKIIVPVWRLNNHQAQTWEHAQVPVIFPNTLSSNELLIEGTWANSRAGAGFIAIDDVAYYNARCDARPLKALRMLSDCAFDRDFCEYITTQDSNSDSWLLATPVRKPPRTILDHTFNSPAARPLKALRMLSDCAFDRDFCEYITTQDSNSDSWLLATPVRKPPRTILDHTFNSPAGGFAFFEIFLSQQRRVTLLGPRLTPFPDGTSDACLTFWFLPFGTGDSTTLRVKEHRGQGSIEDIGQENDNGSSIWEIQTTRLDLSSREWMYGQVPVRLQAENRLIFEGVASQGGFALDDVRLDMESNCQRIICL